MQIQQTVSVPQAEWIPVAREVHGFNSTTRQEGIFRTAEEHGCRRVNCTQHWEKHDLPPQTYNVTITIDVEEVARQLAFTAARNRTGRAVEFGGLLKAKATKA